MKLYKVTCISKSSYGENKEYDIFIIATDPTVAENLAIKKMRDLRYMYSDGISIIEEVASEELYAPSALLCIQKVLIK